ncbi:Zn(II)2Cys6 transcription factor domain-containing protein [Aspergillus lucknowensis]|uniref:Zn(2)-C6 fungal-type domain-containing protein n=1 Tax=Aspergillus lucknowensis TaxID=176173 RepID=A0ABR4LSV3_9EURO
MPAPKQSPSAATASTSADDPPLRTSCGNCNQAKVRCSKDRPTCRRCASRKTTCVYGVSLRGTKRPRPESQPDEADRPVAKKRPTSLPSPAPSDIFPATVVDIAGQAPYFSNWNSDLCGGTTMTDGLGGILPFNSFEPTLGDQPPFSFPLGDANSPSSPVQPFVGPPMALPTMTIPLSPISPPASRDSNLRTLSTAPSTASLGSCCCRQTIGYKVAEMNNPKQRSAFVMNEFLAEHRANMALCTTVLECSAPQHKAGMILLVELIALLFQMVLAFDQIEQQRQMIQLPPTALSAPTSPSDHRKEQVAQATVLRAELAKLGALIQEFDRRYCSLDGTSWGEDTFLLSPLFVNLQWKTQARFDAVRSWMPWL